ncbi:MAG: hypothetical protein LUH58_10030 [Lachnospiraceae bacterium]|nr:hypothetical protein [Lachnospiraceae bacterium]
MADIDPLGIFNFSLRVEGVYDVPCKSIKQFTRANEFEYVQEGGLNDYVHMLRKPISQPFTFQVERYVDTESVDPLKLGTDLLLPICLTVNRKYGGSRIGRLYFFTGCTVISRDYGELNSESSGLLTDITTISYRELFVINNTLLLGKDSTWEFDGTKVKGNGKQSARQVPEPSIPTKADELAAYSDMLSKNGPRIWKFDDTVKIGKVDKDATPPVRQSAEPPKVTEATQSELEAKAKKWKFDKTSKEGNKKRSAVQNEKEVSQSELEKKAVEWEFDKTSKEGNKKRSAVQNEKEVSQSELEKNAVVWEFDGTSKKGGGQQSAVPPLVEEASQSELEKNAVEWEFDKTSKGGNKKQSAVLNESELSQAEMQKLARRWPPTKSASNVASYLSAQTDRNRNTPN